MADRIYSPQTIPEELITILDAAAGKRHSRTGSVVACLAVILNRHREMLLRQVGLHPEQIAEREAEPGRPDSREEILARIEQPVRREMAERVLLVSDVIRGLRCPTCHGKPATQPHPLDTDPTYRCGGGHVWHRPLVIEDSSAHPEVLLSRVAETGELPPIPARAALERTDDHA